MGWYPNDGRRSPAVSCRGAGLPGFIQFGLFASCSWFRLLAPRPPGCDGEG